MRRFLIGLLVLAHPALADHYALVDAGGNVVTVIEWDGKADYVPPPGLQIVKSDVAAIGGVYANGQFSAPVPQPLAGQSLISAAQSALTKSDETILRCAENGVAVPPAWHSYRQSLRAIVSGGPGPLPAAPAYPPGT